MFEISSNRRYFNNNSKPCFYLADTCWSAFTNISEDDWEYYLDYRKSQGFNVLQINMLQQWDASQTRLNYKPFAVKEDGTFDFSKYNESYFERADRMFEMAYERGITIALVLLWVNYLPDTWASKMPIHQLGIFPKEMVVGYVDKIMALYDKYEPIYVISGDTDFPSDEVVKQYFNVAINRVKENNPNALTTLHIRGRERDLPPLIKDNPNLDFYMFQSGHNIEFTDGSYRLAEYFYGLEPIRPLLNSEPCYEMMGYSRRVYGRFSREDVRKAAWQSVLSGAHSGITYGAHGIWSWHNSRLVFDSKVGEAFESPYDWRDALHFKGAWDYAFIKHFMEDNGLFDLYPSQEMLLNATPEIRVARNESTILVYIPSNVKLRFMGDYTDYQMTYINLEDRQDMYTSGIYMSDLNETHIPMHRFTRDALLIMKKVK